MKRLLALLAAIGLTLSLIAPAIAADDALAHSGRVVFVADGDVTIPADEQADAVIVIDGNADIRGTVNTLVVVGGTATTTGATVETLVNVGGHAEIGTGTTVIGDVLTFDSAVVRADGVQIGGQIKDITTDIAGFAIFVGAAALAIWIGVGIATLIVGLLMAGLAARQVRIATSLISREPGTTALVGLLSLILPILVGVLLMVTIIGIPAGIGLLFVVWPVVAFIGYVVAAIWLGELLLSRRDRAIPAERPYAAATVGLIVAFVIGLVPLVTAVLSIFGIGAVVLASWRTLRATPRAQPAVAPSPAAA